MKEFAEAAYHPGKGVAGYDILQEFTTKDRVAYKHKHSNRVVMAFRGTNPSNWRDTSTDLLMGFEFHQHSSRFKNASRDTDRLIRKFGKENVSVTGHSLGGSQALYVSHKFGVEAEVYNPFVSRFQRGKTYKHATIHHTKGDWISEGSLTTKAKEVHVHHRKKAKGLTKVGLPVVNTALSHGLSAV